MRMLTGVRRVVKKAAQVVLREGHAPVEISVVTVSPSELFAGRRAVVTGGSRGIGLAIAKKLHREGARVLITGRHESSLRLAAEEVGRDCLWLVHDTADADNAREFICEASAALGGIDIIVLNAGVSLHEGSFREVTCESFDTQISINLRGTFFLAKEFLLYAEKVRPKDANCLIVSSEAGDECSERPYGLTKAALNSLVGGLSRRVCREDIRINALSPGVTATEMIGEHGGKGPDLPQDCSTADFASGRLFLPEEVAEVAAFLMSPAAQCISGEVIHCNRGNHLPVSRYVDDAEHWRSMR